MAALLEARDVVKTFGATRALDGFDFRLERGEIHALLGRNGAGKSTFIKILAGLHEPDAGTISVLGAPLGVRSDAFAFIHQDLGLVPTLSVADNFGLVAGFEGRLGTVNDRRLERETAASLAMLGVDLDPRTLVADLPVSERTLVAIARALHLDAGAIVLDEPTASLPAHDVEHVFEVLRRLRDRGVGILYVSHRLKEVRALADRITVLRNGAAMATMEPSDVSESQLAASIMGEEVVHVAHGERAHEGDVVLRARGLTAPGLEPLDLDVRAGEVLGCAGLRGAGQELVGRALYGLLPREGAIEIDGRPYRGSSPAAALARRIAYVGGDRTQSIARKLSVAENLFINPRYSSSASRRVSPRRERRSAEDLVDRFGIVTPGTDDLIEALSGGNAQKVVLARALEAGPRLLLLEEPTAGVDVGARAEFYKVIDEACRRGVAVVLASSDAEEVCEMADRVLVFERGAVHRELTGFEVTVERVTAASMGAWAA